MKTDRPIRKIRLRRLAPLLLLLLPGVITAFVPSVAGRGGLPGTDELSSHIRRIEAEAERLERGSEVEHHFAALSERLGNERTVPVIVRLRVPFSPQVEVAGGLRATAQRRVIDVARERLVAVLPSGYPNTLKTYRILPFVAVRVDRAGLDSLRESPELLDIEEDRINYPQLPENITRSVVPAAQTSGFDGTGQTVALLNSGVDGSHDALKGKVVAEACFSSNSPALSITSLCAGKEPSATGPGSASNCDAAIRGCVTGTAVAGIVAGRSQNFSGIAPGAGIASIQIFSKIENSQFCGPTVTSCILSFDSDIMLAIEYVYQLRDQYRIAAVGMGAGSGRFAEVNCDYWYTGLNVAIDLLATVDIPFISPVGDSGSIGSVVAPACISNVISVGATDSNYRVLTYSNVIYYMNLLAPGESIYTSLPGNRFGDISGSHVAASQVAGACAVLRQKQPQSTLTEVLAALTRSGKPITHAATGLTFPQLQLDAAILELDKVVSPNPAPINLSLTRLPTNDLQIDWVDRSSNETGFRVMRRVRDREDWRVIGTVGPGRTSFVDNQLLSNAYHDYRIIATFVGAESLPSHQINTFVPLLVPPIPTSLSAIAVASYRVDLTWQHENLTSDKVRILRWDPVNSTNTLFVQDARIKSFSDIGLRPGSIYEYSVFAIKGEAVSIGADLVRVQTPQTDIAVMLNDGGSLIDFGQVTPTSDQASPVMTKSFRIRNFSQIRIGLNLQMVRPVTTSRSYPGEEHLNFRYTVTDNRGVTVEAGPDPYKLELAPDEQRQVTIRFNPTIPAPTTIPLISSRLNLLPPLVEADFVIKPTDLSKVDNPSIRLIGRVDTRARLINPTQTNLPPTVEFRRDGNGIEVSFSLYDPNLDTSRVTYQFYDQIGRAVGKPISYYPGPFLRTSPVLPGMSLTITRRFTGLERFSDLRSVRVTIFDSDGSDNAVSIPDSDVGTTTPK